MARGHEVVVFELAGDPGGQVRLTAQSPRRREMIGLIDWRVGQCEKLGVRFHYNTWAEADTVLAESPDAVIVATRWRPIPNKHPLVRDDDFLLQRSAMSASYPSDMGTSGAPPSHSVSTYKQFLSGTSPHRCSIDPTTVHIVVAHAWADEAMRRIGRLCGTNEWCGGLLFHAAIRCARQWMRLEET